MFKIKNTTTEIIHLINFIPYVEVWTILDKSIKLS